ncbi:unnamed protein product [Adineta steineri]|uniref:Uncharacterized protein n=1 Tax=Adineta steineri TaxID=433720 RepID=A0A813T4I2_9BILA|nr:unnamed protein product [Adineta steineri]CAF0920676.1 unnamed protein product [Adineta steineri]
MGGAPASNELAIACPKQNLAYIRSTIEQERLSSLALINIEKDYQIDIDTIVTHFMISWLKKVDLSDNPVRRWLKQGTNSSTFVSTLFKTGDRCCENKGWQSIECHMNNKKYRDSIKLFKENTTFTARTESTLSMITVAAL